MEKLTFPTMNDGMNLGCFYRKRKKPVYINLLVLKEGNWFFEVLRIQRKKKQMKVSESNSKVVCVSQGAGAKRYFQSETD